MSKILLVANWKMNPQSTLEAQRLFETIKKGIKDIYFKNIEVVICPPYLWLATFALESHFKAPKNSVSFQLGAQDCFWQQKGAYTGAISPLMLKNLNCGYVIVGHSERRKYFAEDDKIVNKKLKAALEVNLRPILCIGEEKEERDQLKDILESQLKIALENLATRDLRKIVIAYEPVWAIGSGKYCNPENVFSVNLMVRKFLTLAYGKNLAQEILILYGGSVDSKNAVSYIKEAKMDGLLVGGASLNGSEFVKIVKSIMNYL